MRIAGGMTTVALLFVLALVADSDDTVPYPTGYRTWTVTRSFIAGEGATPVSIITTPTRSPLRGLRQKDHDFVFSAYRK